ncbi:MAG: hypothetical protein ACOYT4_03700 [Nanoarchaeota archaeon]
MISGKTVYDSLNEKIGELEKNQVALDNEINSQTSQIHELGNEREEIISKLCKTYLPKSNPNSIDSSFAQNFPQIRENIKQIFLEKQNRINRLNNLITETKETNAKLELELEKATESLNLKADEKNDLTLKVNNALNHEIAYQNLESKAKSGKEKLEQNEKIYTEMKNLSDNNLSDYENNSLFMYLLKRKLPGNNTSGIIEKLDSWIARMINFEEQRKNYIELRDIPILMERELSTEKKDLEATVKEMQNLEKEFSDKYGLTQVVDEGTKLNKQRNETIAKIKDNEYSVSQYLEEKLKIDSDMDPYYMDALTKEKELLEHQTIAELKNLASLTPGTEDDGLVRRLGEINSTIEDCNNRIEVKKSEIGKICKKISGLKEIKSEYHQKNFDSGDSYFQAGFDFNSLLMGYMLGAYNHSSILTTIRDNQRFKQSQTYSSHNYSSMSRSNAGFGGLGSGSFHNIRGFGGGGGSFHTRGGF